MNIKKKAITALYLSIKFKAKTIVALLLLPTIVEEVYENKHLSSMGYMSNVMYLCYDWWISVHFLNFFFSLRLLADNIIFIINNDEKQSY